jgi:peptidylprolyl isomerase
MRITHAVAASIFALTVFNSALAAGDDIVAKLGATELKQSQLKTLLDSLDADARKQVMTNPATLGQLIQSEIIRRAVLREASDKQWDKRPDVQTQIDRAREQTIVASYLNDVARPPASYPSDDEIKQVYEENKATFTTPVQYHVAQIYVAGLQETQAKKASELAAKAKKDDFSQLASQNSEHKESATKGGDMGWLAEPQLIPELREQLPKMSIGQVSAPIRSASGWHVIKLLETRPSALQPLSEVRDIIVNNLRMRKAKASEQQYLEEMLKSQKLNVNEIAIGALLK